MDINGYQILAQIYESANSIVYRGIRELDRQFVILKILKPDYPTPAQLTHYKQEYEIIGHLDLPGVIKAYSLEEYQQKLVIILEDFGGKSLKQLMNDGYLVPLNPENAPEQISQFLDIALQTTEILGKIHGGNVIHKDINPANILLHPETQQVKIIDFGIASLLSRENPTLKNPNILEGTLTYISPEQTGRMNRSLDYRTDFYSLGITFYELLTGQLPFNSTDPLELVHCQIAKQPIPPHHLNPAIPQTLSQILLKLMAKTAEERYQSAWGLKADLETCQHQLQTSGQINTFPLGCQDIADKFQIPQKLYGREAEIATLLGAYERVTASGGSFPVEMMLVVGYSGMGKSALVQEIYKPITRSRGYFISGKFDQLQRNIPYSALVNALTGLIQQLLTESEVQLQQWREKLLHALGVNGQIIIDLIRELELIIGPQPPVPELGATEAQNRFNLVFQNLIRALCTSDHPLVLFLDDLQWADSATLKLLELILGDRDTEHLFLIGAYRDNEVNATHPLTLTLEAFQQAGVIVQQINLEPLSPAHISQLIADTLHQDIPTVQPLATLVNNKTQGNPFFINEFLKKLHQENLLRFDADTASWQWDIQQIQTLNITDNVVELTIERLILLPPATQKILKLAACMGSEFDLDTLSPLCEQPATTIFSDLKVAIQSGLIWPKSDLDAQLLIQNYQFGHDRIQQAAYTLIDDIQKKEIHFKIGQWLLHNSLPENRTEKIFTIVDHLDQGLALIDTPEEKENIARLNLTAGQKAKAATAYQAAVKYLRTGLELLNENSWQTQYELTLNLYTEAVEAEYLNGDFEQAETLAAVVLENARTVLDQFKVYDAKMQFACVQNQMNAAIDTGLQLLEMLGVTLEAAPPSPLAIESLSNLPPMRDAKLLAAMRVLMNLFSPVYISKPTLLPAIAYTMLHLCVQSGNSAQGAFAYAFYGVLLCRGIDEIERGYQFGQLGMQVLEQFESRGIQCKVREVFNAFIRPWKEPVAVANGALRQTVQLGLETGDLEFAGYSAIHYCAYLTMVGEPLISVCEKQQAYLDLLEKTQQEFSRPYAQIWAQLALNLQAETENPQVLRGSFLDETQMLPVFKKNNNLSALFCLHTVKSWLSYLFKDYEEAVNQAVMALDYEAAMAGLLPTVQHGFYYSLALLGLYETATPDEQGQYLEIVRLNQEKMQKWSTSAAGNFQHKYDLVAAEMARVLGQHWQGVELYERAIQGAKTHGYVQDEALASELAAEFYCSRGLGKLAIGYFKDAHYQYNRWQAQAKVADLEARYPELFPKTRPGNSWADTVSTTTSVTSSNSGLALDLATVIKASQAIGNEIVLEQLLTKLMKIIIENAGAQTGVLLLETHNQFFIEAEGTTGDENIAVLQSIPLENRLPLSIINYVLRTGKIIVLADATCDRNFARDAYIQQHQPQSILCFPISDLGKLIGIVYLENNLTQGTFTPDRVEVLKILSAQAAISIENARLYQTLEDKVKERTAQLAAANTEIMALNERLKAENLRMGAELEVTKELQKMILPKPEELETIEALDIAGFMQPADEVGGDYYDVLQHNGCLKLGIGDVTGHGLESGVLMLMTQTAVRTLQEANQTDPIQFFDILNRTIYGNVQRINPDKNLTLALLDYQNGTLKLSGQHEEIIVVRAEGTVERIDTIDLGFPIGLTDEIAEFIATTEVQLNLGDVVVLYTDGITEAFNGDDEQYGLERLCEVVRSHRTQSALEIRQVAIDDVRRHIGTQKVFDDLTLVILKQK